MYETYLKYLISKGYRKEGENGEFSKNGELYVVKKGYNGYYVVIPDDLPFEGAHYEEMSDDELYKYEYALCKISYYYTYEFGGEGQTPNRLDSIPLAYTDVDEETEEGVREVEVEVILNLTELTLYTFIEKQLVDEYRYDSIEDLNTRLIKHLVFDDLVSVPMEWMARRHLATKYLKKHDEPLTLNECKQLLKSMVSAGLMAVSKETKMLPWNDGTMVWIYHRGSDNAPEGWYPDSVRDAAKNLSEDTDSQRELFKTLAEEGFEPIFERDGREAVL